MSLLCAFFRNVDIFRLWLRNEHRHVTLHLIRGSLLMNALTAVHNNAVDSGQDYSGFTLIPSSYDDAPYRPTYKWDLCPAPSDCIHKVRGN